MAYGDNRWLSGAVDHIARELPQTKFHLKTTNAKSEIQLVMKHVVLDVLHRLQPAMGIWTRRQVK